MSKKNGAMPKILVMDAGRGSAIAIIRSLGRHGYRVVAADSDEDSLGFRSRYAKETFVYPAPEQAPDAYCARILEEVKARGVALVIPATDLTMQPLRKARKDFAPLTKLAIAEDKHLEAVTNKDKTVELARELGVPVPKTYTVSTAEDALARAEELGWPVVLKPHISRMLKEGEGIEKFSVTYANDPEELRRLMLRFEGNCSVLLQRYLRGIGYGVELLMHEGEPIAAFEHKRLREIPITGGPSSYRQSVALHKELYDYSVRLLGAIKWTGLAMVEFKVGDSRTELMEINGRVWGSLPLAVTSGVDFPGKLAQLYLQGADSIPKQLNSEYKINLKCRDLGRDLMWMYSVLARRQKYPFLGMPRRSQVVSAFFSLFNPANKFDLLSLDDPIPGLIDLPRIYTKFRRKINEE